MEHFSQIILRQIGVSTRMATGARTFLFSDADKYLQFNVGRGNLTKIRVTLTPADTYTVEMFKINRKSLEVVTLEKAENVYGDQLGEIIYHMVNK